MRFCDVVITPLAQGTCACPDNEKKKKVAIFEHLVLACTIDFMIGCVRDRQFAGDSDFHT